MVRITSLSEGEQLLGALADDLDEQIETAPR